MALDIREGDDLTVSGRDYPIIFCGVWTTRSGSTASMKRMCSVTAGTKRPPAPTGSVRGAPAVNLTGIKCQPLDPAGQKDVALKQLPYAPYELLRTIVDGGDTFYELFVEKVRKKAA